MRPKGDRIYRLRKEAGLHQADLAAAAGVDPALISEIETAHRRASVETVGSIRQVLADRLGRDVRLAEISIADGPAHDTTPREYRLPDATVAEYATDDNTWGSDTAKLPSLEGEAFRWHRLESDDRPDVPPVTVYSLHDGRHIPAGVESLLSDGEQGEARLQELKREFSKHRDWGAGAVAQCIAGALGLHRFGRVEVARPFVDYGRMPGVTTPTTPHLRTKSIGSWAGTVLPPAAIRACLDAYDRCASGFEARVREDLGLPPNDAETWRADGSDLARCGRIFVEVHTCDDAEIDGERRPDLSVIFRTDPGDEVQRDRWVRRLIPTQLYRFTADRLLPVRLLQNFEHAGYYAGINSPYHLPRGSIAVRLHRWAIAHILSRYVALKHEEGKVPADEYPKLHEVIANSGRAWSRLWSTIANANTRDPKARLFLDYVNNRCSLSSLSGEARQEIESVAELAEEVDRYLREPAAQERLEEWRWSPERMSVVALEVTKSTIWNPRDGLLVDNIHKVARIVAQSLLDYLNVDRPMKERLVAEKQGQG